MAKKGTLTGKVNKVQPWWEPLMLVFLFWYPLRHIHWGIDWWDTGYNYANFEHAGLEHMDPMWFFSTYLANVVGHVFTMLPSGHTLVGMNLYTGLLVSVLALMGYFFCTRKLEIPRGIVFVGEFVAISLCWCPTALLYNYLTYVLYLGCVILLYRGLSEERKWLLFGAGVCLGTNVLVRFSNLPEMAMIVAVWAYAFLVWLEERKGKSAGKRSGGDVNVGKANSCAGGFPMAVRNTLWCLGGYLAALAVLLGYIFMKYGADTYVNSIMRLFAMTENATDYKATSMLDGMVSSYIENLYWVLRMGVFVVAGTICFAGLKLVIKLLKKFCRPMLKKLMKKESSWLDTESLDRTGAPVVVRALWGLAYVFACGLAVVMVVWLYVRGFCSLEFYSYGAMLWPAVTFLMLTLGIACIRVLHPKCPLNEKLISGMIILVVLLTSLGSNNKVFPSMNNLFVAAPYTLWQCYRFVRYVKDWKFISSFPAKAVLMAFLGMFLFQITGFGLGFVFGEATGLQNVTTVIENNQVLEGVKMSPERAEIMTGITDYAKENGLIGREVITYGRIPSICYYLEMPPAFNSWSDLDSYQYRVMEGALEELAQEIASGAEECPVIILNNADLTYEESPKFGLLRGYMEKYNYDLIYEDEKFKVYLTE